MKLYSPRIWETSAVFLIALAVRFIRLDHTPVWDEFYHVLAARSWLTEGTFAIADGHYERAFPYTWLVSWFTNAWSDPFVAGRVPAALFGSTLVALLFYWTARIAGRGAGWVASMMLCFAGLSIFLSQLVRFYSLHALCFVFGVYGIFQTIHVARSVSERAVYALVSVVFLGVALSLQLTTIIGVAGIGVYVGFLVIQRWGKPLLGTRQGLVVIVVSVLAAGTILFLLISNGVLDKYWQTYQSAPRWGADNVSKPQFYVAWFHVNYPILWWLSPFAMVYAIWRYRTFGIFCLTIFSIAFLLHSFAAAKASRYLFYVMPFFFALWGIALAELGGYLARLFYRETDVTGRGSGRSRGAVTFLMTTGLMVLSMVPNRGYQTGSLMMLRPDSEWRVGHPYRGFADWASAREELKPMVEQAEVFLTSSGVKSLFYFDRLDYNVSVTVLAETDTKQEFGIDHRVGRPVISKTKSLEKLMNEHESGLIVIDARRWRSDSGVTNTFADFLEARAERLAFPEKWKLVAFRWGF